MEKEEITNSPSYWDEKFKNEIWRILDEFILEKDLNKKEIKQLAQACDVKYRNFKRIYKCKDKISLLDLNKILTFFNLKLEINEIKR